jgi:hypothetical protein
MKTGDLIDQGSKYYYNTGIFGGAISLRELVKSDITGSSFYSNYANFGGSIFYEE